MLPVSGWNRIAPWNLLGNQIGILLTVLTYSVLSKRAVNIRLVILKFWNPLSENSKESFPSKIEVDYSLLTLGVDLKESSHQNIASEFSAGDSLPSNPPVRSG